MPIFPKIEVDKTVQVDDKFQIFAGRSYVTKDMAAISKVEIEPDTGVGFIDVTDVRPENWFLNYQYATDGEKTISVRVTSGLDPDDVFAIETITVECLSEADDKLLSDDQDLVAIESKILGWIPKGRASFKYVHREAQRQILEWLWVNGYRKSDDTRIGKPEIIEINEFRFWSKFAALRIIFNDISNATDDIFSKKAQFYEKLEITWKSKSVLKVDVNGDGAQDTLEGFDLNTRNLVRE